MKKGIITLCALGILFNMLWLWGNQQIPLGYDHGAYREFIGFLQSGSDYYSLRPYLQSQFEPFSGVLFYYLGTIMSASFMVTWLYAIILVGTGLWFFFIGKKGSRYTSASYLGFALLFFSVIQYMVFWWGFGKELIATFFLFGAIRHRKKIIISTLFMAACMALHRLTGFVGLLFIIALFLDENIKEKRKYLWLLFFSIVLASMTYFWTWGKHVVPFVGDKISSYIFLKHPYGTLFSEGKFWFFEGWLLLVGALSGVIILKKRIKIKLIKNHFFLFCFMACMVITRSIAYTRLGAFFDLMLILMLAQLLPQIFTKKILLFIVAIQSLFWLSYTSRHHVPDISPKELSNIESLHRYVPKDSQIFTLNTRYMPWLQGYSKITIVTPSIRGYAQKQGTSLSYIMQNKNHLCDLLQKMPKNTYLFVGERERWYPSIQNNQCLSEIIYINSRSRVFTLHPAYKTKDQFKQS